MGFKIELNKLPENVDNVSLCCQLEEILTAEYWWHRLLLDWDWNSDLDSSSCNEDSTWTLLWWPPTWRWWSDDNMMLWSWNFMNSEQQCQKGLLALFCYGRANLAELTDKHFMAYSQAICQTAHSSFWSLGFYQRGKNFRGGVPTAIPFAALSKKKNNNTLF